MSLEGLLLSEKKLIRFSGTDLPGDISSVAAGAAFFTTRVRESIPWGTIGTEGEPQKWDLTLGAKSQTPTHVRFLRDAACSSLLAWPLLPLFFQPTRQWCDLSASWTSVSGLLRSAR